MTIPELSTPAPLKARLQALLALQGRTEHDAARDAGYGDPWPLWRDVGRLAGSVESQPYQREQARCRLADAFRVTSSALGCPAILTRALMADWDRAQEWQRARTVQILTESQQAPDTRNDGAAVGLVSKEQAR